MAGRNMLGKHQPFSHSRANHCCPSAPRFTAYKASQRVILPLQAENLFKGNLSLSVTIKGAEMQHGDDTM